MEVAREREELGMVRLNYLGFFVDVLFVVNQGEGSLDIFSACLRVRERGECETSQGIFFALRC